MNTRKHETREIVPSCEVNILLQNKMDRAFQRVFRFSIKKSVTLAFELFTTFLSSPLSQQSEFHLFQARLKWACTPWD